MPSPSPAPPRRVLMTADFVGSVWQWALDLSSYLIARGARITLAVMGPSPIPQQLAAAECHSPRLDLEVPPFSLEWMGGPWAEMDAAEEWLTTLEQRTQADIVHVSDLCHASLAWQAPTLVTVHSCDWLWDRGGRAAPRLDGDEEYRQRAARDYAPRT